LKHKKGELVMLEKKLLENLFVKGKISRRDFISGLSALGVKGH